MYMTKGRFQNVVRWMAGSWMSANMATALGSGFVILTAGAYYLGLSRSSFRLLLPCVPLFLLLRLAMNALDGMLAREYGTGSVAGEILNEALDVIGDTVSYGVLYFVPDGPRLSIVALVLAIWSAEYFGVLGKGMPGGVRRHEAVLGGKPDRAIWLSVLALILYFRPGFIQHTPYYLGLVTVFVLLTALARVKKTIEVARGHAYESYTWVGR